MKTQRIELTQNLQGCGATQSAPHSSMTRRAVRDRLQRGDGASVPRAIEGLGVRLSPEGDFSSNSNGPGAHLLGNVKRGRKTR